VESLSEPVCTSLEQVLKQLDEAAPDAPFLALGQTIFWDEPMKAGLALNSGARKFIAGVHDTDYFAKLPSGLHANGAFKALPHNDTTTRGLWSAAGEFSTLFGGETVITRDMLASAGLRINTIQRARPNILDEATEAWGWRGIVSTSDHSPVTADIPLRKLLPELCTTIKWAFDQTLASIGGEMKEESARLAESLHAKMCDFADNPTITVAAFYEEMLPELYDFGANTHVDLETTRTSRLLRFNSQTASLPRFELFDLFIRSDTYELARRAYNQAIHGSALYPLERFGTGAIPFDLVIPGLGRGTLRLGNRGAVIMTDPPQFLTYKQKPSNASELASAIEAKFGPNCAVVGKAVSLIGMLAREFVFVFHEGASGYVKYSRKLHQVLAEAGFSLPMNPILRIRYDAWSSMTTCCSWLKLPKPFQRPFGSDELCTPSFAARWTVVAGEQEERLHRLGELRRPIDLIRYLDDKVGGAWSSLAEEYLDLHQRLGDLEKGITAIRQRRYALYARERQLSTARTEAEAAKGKHFREYIFEKEPTEEQLLVRQQLTEEVERIIHERTRLVAEKLELRREQNALVGAEEVMRIHQRRREVELEAELKRLSLIREAVISSKGLRNANLRPSAWWFRLVCPDGKWFRRTTEQATYYLETLS
jgi:hypothetical protein